MKKLSKLLALLLALAMVFSVLAACSKSDDKSDSGKTDTTADNGGSSSGGQSTDAGSSGGSDASTDGEKDTTLTIGVTDANGTFDAWADNQTPHWQNDMIFEKLLYLNPYTNEFEYQLATSIEYIDDLVIEIKLRDDVYFTDGQHLTAKDVFYTYKEIWAANAQASYFTCYDWDASEIVDDYTIHFVLTESYGPAITYMANYGIYCYDDILGDNPADADKWMSAPNGTGPYIVEENVAASYITYVRKDADDYWGELPECSKATYKYYSETTTMFIDFESGAIDVANNVAQSDAERVIAGDCPDFTGYYVQSAKDNVMCILSEGKEIWEDERVREAFMISLDCDSIGTAAYGCLYKSADSILPSTISYYESQGTYEYNPERAKELLAEAGYPDGVELRLIATSQFQTLAEALQASVAAAGFTVSVETYDPGTAIPMMRNMESDFILKEATGGASVNEPGQLIDTMSPDSTLPPARFTDPEWSDAFYQAARSTDSDERAEGFAKLQQWAFQNYRAVGICERQNMTVYNTNKIDSFVFASNDTPTAIFCRFK